MIPLSVPNFSGKELEYVTHAVESTWVSTAGTYVQQFEQDLAAYVGADQAVACQSGTAGLHLAMRIFDVGPGDLILCPTLTFIAAVNPVRYQGADPVFMDCDETLCMDPVKVRRYLTEECERGDDGVLYEIASHRPMRGILLVHVFGNLAKIEELCAIAEEFNLFLVEDATEALGTYDMTTGKHAGTFGDIGVYSFNGNKIITTGGGGALVAKNPEHAHRAKHLSTQAKADELYFDHDEVGYNYRMTNVQAALGVAQLEQIETFIHTKATNYSHYAQSLELLPFRSDIRPNYWFYSYLTEDRDGLLKYLSEQKIQTRPIWKLIHSLPMYRDCRAYEIDVAEKYYEKILNIPCSSNLQPEQVDEVIGAIQVYENEIREEQ